MVMWLGNRFWFRIDSLLVGYIFFDIGFYLKTILGKIATMNRQMTCIGIMVSLSVLMLSALLNLDLADPQGGFSINACRFGHYPLLFIVSGISGTLSVLFLSRLITFRSKTILNISNGTIVILGFHWMVFIYVLKPLTINKGLAAFLISFLCLAICYVIIQLCGRYCSAILGGRKLN